MSKLEKTLNQWVSLHLIDQKQADRIYQYESTKSGHSWVLMGLLVLGITIVGIGIISVIAANWQQISAALKLSVDFAILILLSLLIVRAWNLKKEIQFEILLLFFMVFCLASIGLISQIYNTGGKLYQAVMLWSLITLPAVTAARHLVIPFLWTSGFLISLTFTALFSPQLDSFYQHHSFFEWFQPIFMAVPLIAACVALFGERWSLENVLIRAFQSWLFISGCIAITFIDLTHPRLDYYLLKVYLPGYLLAVCTAVGILQYSEYKNSQKLLLLLALGTFLILFHLPMVLTLSVIYALFTILILLLMGIFFASIKNRFLFQLALLLLGLRFLGLYFQALGGLALTGIGLIISGLLIITITVLWNKYKSALASWIERWIE